MRITVGRQLARRRRRPIMSRISAAVRRDPVSGWVGTVWAGSSHRVPRIVFRRKACLTWTRPSSPARISCSSMRVRASILSSASSDRHPARASRCWRTTFPQTSNSLRAGNLASYSQSMKDVAEAMSVTVSPGRVRAMDEATAWDLPTPGSPWTRRVDPAPSRSALRGEAGDGGLCLALEPLTRRSAGDLAGEASLPAEDDRPVRAVGSPAAPAAAELALSTPRRVRGCPVTRRILASRISLWRMVRRLVSPTSSERRQRENWKVFTWERMSGAS
mmetsp:Transcript_11919/g.34403  ORF Transcript_11919/g.34403 Transcript_11919/m.34403 type:complete len:275 (-) Transcript_11919:2307-3131(-)